MATLVCLGSVQILAEKIIPGDAKMHWVILTTQINLKTTGEILMTLAVLVALVVSIAVVAWIARRLIIRPYDNLASTDGFTLSDIRRLHQEGQMSDEEFETAKRLVLASGLATMGTMGVDSTPDDADTEHENLPGHSDKMNGDSSPREEDETSR